jgi:hypothetical protein
MISMSLTRKLDFFDTDIGAGLRMTLLTTVQRLLSEAPGACIVRCMAPALCCFVLGSST